MRLLFLFFMLSLMKKILIILLIIMKLLECLKMKILISVVKTDYFSAFIEFDTENYENDKDNILKVIDEVKENNKDKIDSIIYGKDFYKDY